MILLGLAVAGVSAPSRAAADGVLGPESARRFLEALRHVGADLEIRSVQVEPVVVRVAACAAPSGCFDFRIERGGSTCAEDPEAPWCVTVPDAVPADLAARIRSAMGTVAPESVWYEPPTVPPEPVAQAAEPPPPTESLHGQGAQTTAAILTVLIPLVVGFLAGAVLRWGRARSLLSGVATSFAFAVAVAIGTWWGFPGASVADTLLTTVIALGGWIAAWSSGWVGGLKRVIAGVVLGAVLALLLEGATRLLLPSPPEMQPLAPDYPGFMLSRDGAVPYVRWSVLDPESPVSHEAIGSPAEVPMVLHLGNSVVEGVEVSPSDRFVARVDDRDPGARHVNLAVGGTGPDFAWALARNWISAGRADQVVLYLHPNAFDFIGAPHRFCKGPIAEPSAEGPVLRCAKPAKDAEARMQRQRRVTDNPFVVLNASRESYLARHLCTAHQDALNPVRNPLPIAVRRALLRGVLDAFADVLASAGVPWVGVILPGRPELEGDPEQRRRHDALVNVAREVLERRDVPLLDATSAVAAAGRDGIASLFVDRCCHLSVRGHEVLAEWVGERLVPILARQRHAPRPAEGLPRPAGGEPAVDTGG